MTYEVHSMGKARVVASATVESKRVLRPNTVKGRVCLTPEVVIDVDFEAGDQEEALKALEAAVEDVKRQINDSGTEERVDVLGTYTVQETDIRRWQSAASELLRRSDME